MGGVLSMKQLWNKIMNVVPTLWGILFVLLITTGGIALLGVFIRGTIAVWGGM